MNPCDDPNLDPADRSEFFTAPSYTWEFCRSCGGAGWVGSRFDHRHPDCGHRCILCYPPPGYDRTYAVEVVPDGT